MPEIESFEEAFDAGKLYEKMRIRKAADEIASVIAKAIDEGHTVMDALDIGDKWVREKIKEFPGLDALYLDASHQYWEDIERMARENKEEQAHG